MLTAVASIIIFGFLIFIHELGHFLTAKKVGIKVHEFAIGFGTKLFTFRKGETLYSLRLLPLGGFVRMAGMDPEDSGDADDERGFNKKPLWARFLVISAGSLTHFLLAILIFAGIFFTVGIPQNINVIGSVAANFPASQAGLKPGDRIVAINDQQITNWQQLVQTINENPEKPLVLKVQRGEQEFSLSIAPQFDPQTRRGVIGIGPSFAQYDLFNSLKLGILQTGVLTGMVINGIGQMITGQMAPDVLGPVGVVQVVGQTVKTGLVNLFNLAAILSINLGLINLFPIPMLDGGRLVFLGIEAIRGRPVDPKKENFVHFIGFVLLMLLAVIVTFKDLARLNLF